jgi:hypothetical protein
LRNRGASRGFFVCGARSYSRLRHCHPDADARVAYRCADIIERQTMGKYFLAWLLGVPAVLLAIVYFFFN